MHATFITMSLYIEPATLEGQPLILKAMAPDDYSVRVLERFAGRIMAKPVSGGRVVWFWTVTGPYVPSHLQPSHGEAESLDEAKAAFRAKFDAWLAWAKDLQHPVVWSQGAGRADSGAR